MTLTPEQKSVPRFTRLRIGKPERFISDLNRTPKGHVLKYILFGNVTLCLTNILLPLRLGKAERVWCGGARETHSATRHNEGTPSKTKELLKSPCFFKILMVVNFHRFFIEILI